MADLRNTPDDELKYYFTGAAQKQWNSNRLGKLYEILGESWFPGKRILEVAAGHGENGKALAAKGASVLFTEGRELFVNFLKKEGLDAQVLDLDGAWTLDEQFDLIVHWGVLYHLDKWKESLESALEHAPLVCLETIVSESRELTFELKRKEDGYDQALLGTGTIMSAEYLESHLSSLGATFVRYDDLSLDANGCANYSWFPGEPKIDLNWRRRFWMVRKAA